MTGAMAERTVRRKRPGPFRRGVYRFERFLLGVGMTMVAFVIERRLIKAIKKGQAKPAPRTAGGPQRPAEETELGPGE